jgi:hypothetical protein
MEHAMADIECALDIERVRDASSTALAEWANTQPCADDPALVASLLARWSQLDWKPRACRKEHEFPVGSPATYLAWCVEKVGSQGLATLWCEDTQAATGFTRQFVWHVAWNLEHYRREAIRWGSDSVARLRRSWQALEVQTLGAPVPDPLEAIRAETLSAFARDVLLLEPAPCRVDDAVRLLQDWATRPALYDVFWWDGLLEAHTLRFLNWCLQHVGTAAWLRLRENGSGFDLMFDAIEQRCYAAIGSLRAPHGGCFNARGHLAERFDRLHAMLADVARGGDGSDIGEPPRLKPRRKPEPHRVGESCR